MSTKHINKNKKTALIIYKNNGKFYNVFDIDAYIFNILFNYKVINNKAGFPDNALNKIINTIENEKISYQIIYKDKDAEGKKFKFNTYSKYYNEAKNKILLNDKLNLINKKLMVASADDLERIIDIINESL
ncbi:MAG: hypothetical protein PHG03_00755 [Bacilli bacterium]|nr:hypothetical protein [Bacilli bacterium]MDD4795075.1 hypothetical protein [Bacilli bacterium]